MTRQLIRPILNKIVEGNYFFKYIKTLFNYELWIILNIKEIKEYFYIIMHSIREFAVNKTKNSFWSLKLIIIFKVSSPTKGTQKWLRESNTNFILNFTSHIYLITSSLQIGWIRWIIDTKVFCFYKLQKKSIFNITSIPISRKKPYLFARITFSWVFLAYISTVNGILAFLT